MAGWYCLQGNKRNITPELTSRSVAKVAVERCVMLRHNYTESNFMSKKEIDSTEVGKAIMKLAEQLTVDDCEITTDEILDVIEGRLMSVEEVGSVRAYLAT